MPVAAWLLDLLARKDVDGQGQLPAGISELFEACWRQNEVATLAPQRLRIDINRAGVTPPILLCEPSSARSEEHARFDVMLLSPKAGGVGLTLTAANHVVHLSRWWNPAVEDQCSDRVYRIGQTRPVHIYYPLAVLPDAQEYSFDVQLQQLMARKRKLAQDLLAPPAFTTEDYKALVAGTLRANA